MQVTERTPEFVLGLIGGIIGIATTPGLFFLGGFVAYLGGPATLLGAAIAGGILSILGLIGAAFVKNHPILSGVVMFVSGLLGIFVALGLWIGSLLLLVAGIVALIRREKPMQPLTPQPVYYCTSCGKPLKYLSQYQKWFCEICRTYPPTREEILQRASRALDEGNTELAKRLMDQAKQ